VSPSIRTEIFSSGKHRGRPKPGSGYTRRLRDAVLTAGLACTLAVAFTIAGIIAPQPSSDGAGAAPSAASAGSAVASPAAQQNSLPAQSPSSQKAVKAVLTQRLRDPPPSARRPVKPVFKQRLRDPPPSARRPAWHLVSGHVRCSTMPVEGVWIVASKGGSGWAAWHDTRGPRIAYYGRRLPRGGPYAVHVGCGGSPKHWRTTPDSAAVSGTVNNFLCGDVTRRRDHDTCRRTG
jgi:hypothetical protein